MSYIDREEWEAAERDARIRLEAERDALKARLTETEATLLKESMAFTHAEGDVVRLQAECDSLRAQRDAAVTALNALYSFPGVSELLAPSGSLGSIRDIVDAALLRAKGEGQ